MAEAQVNRKHKDRLFTHLFSDKENALSLFNALSGRALGTPTCRYEVRRYAPANASSTLRVSSAAGSARTRRICSVQGS